MLLVVLLLELNCFLFHIRRIDSCGPNAPFSMCIIDYSNYFSKTPQKEKLHNK